MAFNSRDGLPHGDVSVTHRVTVGDLRRLVKEASEESWLETVKTLREEIMAYFGDAGIKASWQSSGVPGFYAVRMLMDDVRSFEEMFDTLRSIVWMLTGEEPNKGEAVDDITQTETIVKTSAIRISNASTYQSKYFDLGITVDKDRLGAR